MTKTFNKYLLNSMKKLKQKQQPIQVVEFLIQPKTHQEAWGLNLNSAVQHLKINRIHLKKIKTQHNQHHRMQSNNRQMTNPQNSNQLNKQNKVHLMRLNNNLLHSSRAKMSQSNNKNKNKKQKSP